MSGLSALNVRLARKQQQATDICSFELVAADGGSLPAFEAGAHIDVTLPGGLLRSYSLCNPPSETHRYLLGVLRDPQTRGGSQAMHALQEGQLLQISAPKNHFALATQARRHVLLAGGIGITPLLCMAHALAQQGADFALHYAARSAERMAFAAQLQASAFADRVQLHLDDGAPAQQLDLQALLSRCDAGTHLYVCGPQGFIDAVLGSARTHGWPEQALHCEYFGASVQAHDSDAAFRIELAQSGRTLEVPAGKTVVQVLHASGVDVPIACEQGVCGTCLTRVLGGVPDHRDHYLTPEEQAASDQFTPCCSRSKTPVLRLDL